MPWSFSCSVYDLRREVVVLFVDIVSILNHYQYTVHILHPLIVVQYMFIFIFLSQIAKKKTPILPTVLPYAVKGVWFMVFDATFNNISVISWRSVLLVKETGVPRENY